MSFKRAGEPADVIGKASNISFFTRANRHPEEHSVAWKGLFLFSAGRVCLWVVASVSWRVLCETAV